LKKIQLTGEVFSGQGGGRKFLTLPWVKQQIKDKLGFTPYEGTLNLKLAGEFVERRNLLGEGTAMKICPSTGYCTGLLFAASVDGESCGVVIPRVENYPEDVLEIVAAVNLKKKLKLKNGDAVTVTVNV
jgi:riboflavin kinase